MNYPTLKEIEQQARRLAEAIDIEITHSQALEIVARMWGFKDWNTMSACYRPDLVPGREDE